MKILLSAQSCAPGHGSELGQGWNWASELAKLGHQVTVVTRTYNRCLINKAEETCGFQIIFYDLPHPLHKIHEIPFFGLGVHYFLWQYGAAKLVKKRAKTCKFDLVHHITWAALRYPSFMGRTGIPFVFGPIGGGEDTPVRLRKGLGFSGQIFDYLRRLSTWWASIDPFVLQSYKKAAIIFATTNETKDCIPARFQKKVRVQMSLGIDDDSFLNNIKANNAPREPFKLIFAGRLVAWKGVHLVIKAIAHLRDSGITLTIVGSGPDLGRLRKLADSEDISRFVTFIPWVKQTELMKMYRGFDLFVYPSLHDSQGYAVLEALANGCPVMCLDLGGPGAVVTPTCGGAISASKGESEEEVVRKMCAFILELKNDCNLAQQLSGGARRRALEFLWAESVKRVYSQISAAVRVEANLDVNTQNPVTKTPTGDAQDATLETRA